MSGSDAVAGIHQRISTIETRFAKPVADDPGDGSGAVIRTGEFDAFGDVYQEALAARDASGLSPDRFAAAVDPDGFGPLVAGLGFGAAYGLGVPPPGAGPTTEQVAAAIAGVAGAPGVRPVGGYGPMSVPAELRVYGNGRIPGGALVALRDQPNHRLYGPAAASWNRVVEAARADGIELRITDSYRSYDQQVDLARRKGLYSEGGYAATPGTSNHGWGLAVDADVNDAATRQWLKVNGPRFGWVEAVPREPWHWEFRPHQI